MKEKIFQRVDFLLKKQGFYQEFCLSILVKGSKTLALCLRNSLPGDLLHEWKGGTKVRSLNTGNSKRRISRGKYLALSPPIISMSWESEIETNTQWTVKKLSCTPARRPSFRTLMLSSILPHTRSCKASRGGDEGRYGRLNC